MMKLSNYMLGEMGYVNHPASDLLEINFGIIKVYSLRGVLFEKDSTIKLSEKVNFGKNCTVVISESINEASKILVEDVYADIVI